VLRVGLGQVAVELGEVERLDERAAALALGSATWPSAVKCESMSRFIAISQKFECA
jgi:hypothetical protein